MRTLLIAALLVALPAAAEQRIYCPLILDEGSFKIIHAPAGWLGTTPSLARLTGGGLMRLHPSQIAYLRPEKMTRSKSGGTASNTFEAGEERWLWCGYGGTHDLQLSKRLPDAATECTTTYRETKRDGLVELYAECSSPPNSTHPKPPAAP